MEKSLKTGPVQNHIMKLCGNFLYKVLNTAPTTIKQNHPRGTHRKIYLKKWLPITACQRGKKKWREKRKHPDSTESYDRYMGPATTHNTYYTKALAS